MNTLLAVLGLSGGELIVVLGAILILFGAKRIPEFAKGLGQGIREFKKASREVTDEINTSMHESPSNPATQAPRPAANPPAASAPPQSTVPKA